MEIRIDSQGLSEIGSVGQVVTLLRRVDQIVETNLVAVSSPAVAWQAFAPFQTNTVTWTDDFYAFVTTTPIAMTAVLKMNSRSAAPMTAGYIYAFAQGSFVRQQISQSPNAYVVGNATPTGSFSFGLAQAAVVNGASILAPVCVAPVLYNQAAYFSPTTVIATFLSTAEAPGTILPMPSNAFEIAMPSGSGGPTLGFNDQTNTFFQLS